MSIIKPPVLPAWADGGDKVQPSNSEISTGWPSSSLPPSRQRFNWVLNYVANAIRYFSRRGMVDYDILETYQTDDIVRGDNGLLYRSLADSNIGNTPSSTPAKWGSVNTVTPALSDKSTKVATTKFATDYTDAAVAAAISAIPTMAVTPSVIGTTRNAKMALTSASAVASFSADEVVVQSSLGGTSYQLSSFGKTVNLATTGAGGMDTGTAPLSGYVALYAIYNPTTTTANILAVNCSGSIAPEVYAGSSMPAGYTASGLISVWRTNSSGNLVVGQQNDRSVSFVNASAFSISNDVYVSISGTLSIAALVPKNAFSIFGSMQMASLGSTTNYGFSFIGVNSVGMSGYDNYSASAYSDLILAAPQSLSYGVGVGSSPVNVTLNISGYKF